MNIAIIGTRGIPNHHGGFEQCAEYLAVGLTKKGFKVTVYNSHNHPNQEKYWNGVELIHCYDPEYKWGAVGQFIYDLNCILNCRKKKYDIILQLGYTSSSIWGWLLPSKSIITTNMDGLEWKRQKFSRLTRKFLEYAESLGIKYSDYLISDSIGIKDYIQLKYKKDSDYIPYGAHLFNNPQQEVLEDYKITPYNYNLLIARLEPENSIEMILDGVIKSNSDTPFLVVGKHNTNYGSFLKSKYFEYRQIVFTGGIYDIERLNNLRYYSKVYFHGHTVGGTNPSLLEAMASNSLICANDNPFNKYVLGNDAFYFENSDHVCTHIQKIEHNNPIFAGMISNNRLKIKNIYSWDNIINQYLTHFEAIYNTKKVLSSDTLKSFV